MAVYCLTIIRRMDFICFLSLQFCNKLWIGCCIFIFNPTIDLINYPKYSIRTKTSDCESGYSQLYPCRLAKMILQKYVNYYYEYLCFNRRKNQIPIKSKAIYIRYHAQAFNTPFFYFLLVFFLIFPGIFGKLFDICSNFLGIYISY